jgi:HAD superfamily hydrolase (TIGR01509 family)
MEAVIFDMDGVIIDSEPFHWEVNKRIFGFLGIHVPDEEYRQFIGTSNTDMWTAIKRKFGLAQPVSELTAMQQSGNIEYMKNNRIDSVCGAVDLIHYLKKEKILIALASSSPYTVIDIVLHTLNLKNCFDIIVSGEDFKNGKPAPDIFLKTAMLLHVSPEQCVVIEDSTHGVHAAKEANMKCIGFFNKNSGCQDLRRADVVISDFSVLDFQHFTR